MLRVLSDDARVLPSATRTPYVLLLEVQSQIIGQGRSLRSLMPGCGHCQRRSRPNSCNGLSQRKITATCLGSDSSAQERAVAHHLTSQDCRPRGLFNVETWDQVKKRIQDKSEFGQRAGWSVLPLIVKSRAHDVRQEELAYKLLKWFQRIFSGNKLKLWLQPFLIIATTHDGGCLEAVANAISLSDLKKSCGSNWRSLRAYFERTFPRDPSWLVDSKERNNKGLVCLEQAIMNFLWSLAASSVVCYVLAIRDRHNGNILIDDEGHIFHIDFGFMLCGTPGGKTMQNMGGFEHSGGFKLTYELIEVLGAVDEPPFMLFRKAVVDGLLVVRANAEELLARLQLSMLGNENRNMNCFQHPSGRQEAVLDDICSRLGVKGGPMGPDSAIMDDVSFQAFAEKMVDNSIDHWRTRLYDSFQFHMHGTA